MPQLGQKIKLFMCLAPGYIFATGRETAQISLLFPDGIVRTRADVYVGIDPDYTSVKTIIHWKQIVKSKKFQYYDYGWKNKAVYNMTTPPVYKIEDMIVPTAVWSGAKDITISPEDVELLLPHIKHLVFYKRIPYWGHQEFTWGINAPEHLYPDVLFVMNKYQ